MKTILSFTFMLSFFICQGQWTTIATDASDDSAGLEGTLLEYQYVPNDDVVIFRVTCTNLADYSSSPAADFSFYLPNGLLSGQTFGQHWTSSTDVHKTAYIYCDPGGTAPDDYTFDSWSQIIEQTFDSFPICEDCVSIFTDVPNNQITYTFNRTDIIADSEMGGETSATIGLVANVGHSVGWDDALTHELDGASTATFSIDISLSIGSIDGFEEISVHPNPVKDILNLSNYEGITSVTITDVSGKMVANSPIINQATGVDVSHLESGTYLLLIYNKDGLIGRPKFVKN